MYESVPQRPLPVLAKPSHDERARQLFAKDFRKFIMLDVPPPQQALPRPLTRKCGM